MSCGASRVNEGKVELAQETNLAGRCGLYCGLCPEYQSAAKSRCPGCKILSLTISCKVFNCCVKSKGLNTCAECDDFPCEKNNPDLVQQDCFITHKVCGPNIKRIREVGLKTSLHEQRERRKILEDLLANCSEGRSSTFYCTASAVMPIGLINKGVDEAKEVVLGRGISDVKVRAKILRSAIQDWASSSSIDLKLRKKPK